MSEKIPVPAVFDPEAAVNLFIADIGLISVGVVWVTVCSTLFNKPDVASLGAVPALMGLNGLAHLGTLGITP